MPPKAKFQIGDIVRCIDDAWCRLEKGKRYKVERTMIDSKGEGYVAIEGFSFSQLASFRETRFELVIREEQEFILNLMLHGN